MSTAEVSATPVINQEDVNLKDSRTGRAPLASPTKEKFPGGFDALEYLRQHPELAHQKSAVVNLAYEEYCQRREAGETLELATFCERFPRFQTSVRILIEAHQFFQEFPTLLEKVDPAAWPEEGQCFQGFLLEQELGRGAFSRVFLATEKDLGQRQVVVKITLLGIAEANTLGRLNHRNIVPILYARPDADGYFSFLCMPYLGHGTLEDVLDAAFANGAKPARASLILEAILRPDLPKPLSPEDQLPDPILTGGTYVDGIVHLGVQLAGALASMHEQGICHRDLKLSNVLLTPAGRPMLLDFNLSTSSRSAVNQLGGTLPYMSPEHLRAVHPQQGLDCSVLDARADLFSFGVILYELLTGVHPFGPFPGPMKFGEMRQFLLKRQEAPPRPLRQANPDVDQRLAQAVERCLAYNPHDRPASAKDLARDLQKFLSPRRRCGRWLKQHRGWAIMASTLLFGFLAITLGFFCSRPSYAERVFRQGLRAYQQQNYQEAVQHFQEAAAADANQADAFFWQARAHQGLGAWESALADYKRADELRPAGKNKACQGYCLARLNMYKEAIRTNNEAIQAGFDNAIVFNNLGYCFTQLRDLKNARANLDKAINRNPRLQAAYFNRAIIIRDQINLNKGGDYYVGIEDIRQAIALGPPSAELYALASFFGALAAKKDHRWVEPTLDYMARAVALGKKSQHFLANPLYETLVRHPRFQGLVEPSPPQDRPSQLQLLLDPIQDSVE